MLNHLHHRVAAASAFAFFVLATAPAYAAGSNMPWEQPLTQILNSIQGPVAKVLSVIVIIITGPDARVRRNVRRLSAADPDRLRTQHRLRRQLVLPVVLPVRRRSA